MKCFLAVAFLGGLLTLARADQPVITSGPSDLTINAGTGAEFYVTATNAGLASTNVLTYQWSFQGTNIAGATRTSYFFNQAELSQAGQYTATVSVGGQSVSNSANLTILQGTIVQFALSGFSGGGTSNITVELFDHDKPATVQNFLHYIRSGAYSNMFFDRLIPGFVLQGGDFDAVDRTNTKGHISAVDIFQRYAQGGQVSGPGLPLQIANEANHPPFVSNVKGTLSMALPSGNIDGGANAFFFNLVDNTPLDFAFGGGPYTVFGRVIGGSNMLDYFNDTNNFFKPGPTHNPTSVTNNGSVTTNYQYDFSVDRFTNGIVDARAFDATASSFTDLPVNYYGTNIPVNTNLFFVDFSFPDTNAQPHLDTNNPTVAITYPAEGNIVSNGTLLTVRGTAHDDIGLARTFCSLYPDNGANNNLPFGDNVTGTTNWALFFGTVPPGLYHVGVTSQDGAGNLSAFTAGAHFIVTAFMTNGIGTVAATNAANGASVTDAVGAPVSSGNNYNIGAHAGSGQVFVNWTGSNTASVSPNLAVTLNDYTFLTANFIPNTIPGKIAFTFPALGGHVTNGTFAVQGTITGQAPAVTTITSQLFYYSSRLSVGPPVQVTGTNDFSVPITNLGPSHYFVQIVASNALGSTRITNDFNVVTLLTVVNNGGGSISNNLDGQYLEVGQPYTMRAGDAANATFLHWSDGTTTSLNPVETFNMKVGLTLTATFISNNLPTNALTLDSPARGSLLSNGTFSIQGTVSGADTNITTVTAQLFDFSSRQSVRAPIQTFTTGAWSIPIVNLGAGHYYLQVVASNVLGNIQATNDFTVLARMTVVNNGSGVISNNLDGQYLLAGQSYTMRAISTKDAVFFSWSNGTTVTKNPVETFTMHDGLILTAKFINNNLPPDTIVFKYPPPHGGATNGSFLIEGSLNGVAPNVATITCQLFYFTNLNAIGSAVQTTGSTTWSVAQSNNLVPGRYIISATAQYMQGGSNLSVVVTNDFTVLTPLTVITNGRGTITTNLDRKFLVAGQKYTMRAAAKTGSIFYNWTDGTHYFTNALIAFTMSPGLTLTATFISNNIPGTVTITTPANNGRLTNQSVIVAGKFATSITATQITCQIFYSSNALAAPVVAVITNHEWSIPATALLPAHFRVYVVARDSKGRSTLVSEGFDVMAHITLQTNGLGGITHSWVGDYALVGKSYTLKGTPKAGQLFAKWTGDYGEILNNPISVNIPADVSMTANFVSNYFPVIAGTYDGLFYPTNVGSSIVPTNSGYYTLTVGSSGVFSGRLMFPSRSISLFGALRYDGWMGLRGPGLDGVFITNIAQVNLTNGLFSLTGSVYNGRWVATLNANRVAKITTNSIDSAGRYVLTLPGDRAASAVQPGGDGYAASSAAATGALVNGGLLADNTPLSQSTGISKDGVWPFYASLYGGKGIILGWQTNVSTNLNTGWAEWVKPPKTGAYYTNGFRDTNGVLENVALQPIWAGFHLPASNANYQIVFRAGSLAAPVTNLLSVSKAGQFVPVAPANKLKIALTTTGVLSGQFVNPAGKTVLFKGAFTSPAAGGSGYILDTNGETGYFNLTILGP